MRADYEFAGPKVAFKNMYLLLDELPFADELRVGQMREPLGLEVQSSTNDIDFLERGLASWLTAGRNVGAMLQGQCSERALYWAAGVFRADNLQGRSIGPEWAVGSCCRVL